MFIYSIMYFNTWFQQLFFLAWAYAPLCLLLYSSISGMVEKLVGGTSVSMLKVYIC